MKKFDLVRLAPMHHRQLMMLSEGAKVIDVAKATGRSKRQVVYLKNSAAGSQYIEAIVRRKELHAIDNSLVGLLLGRRNNAAKCLSLLLGLVHWSLLGSIGGARAVEPLPIIGVL